MDPEDPGIPPGQVHVGFVCGEDGTEPFITDLYRLCVDNPDWVSFQNSWFITICPRFWNRPLERTPSCCPTVIDNRFDEGDVILNSMVGTLVHEMAHVYGVRDPKRDEKYRINDVYELSAKSKIKNAQNYAFYFSSKCTLSTFISSIEIRSSYFHINS